MKRTDKQPPPQCPICGLMMIREPVRVMPKYGRGKMPPVPQEVSWRWFIRDMRIIRESRYRNRGRELPQHPSHSARRGEHIRSIPGLGGVLRGKLMPIGDWRCPLSTPESVALHDAADIKEELRSIPYFKARRHGLLAKHPDGPEPMFKPGDKFIRTEVLSERYASRDDGVVLVSYLGPAPVANGAKPVVSPAWATSRFDPRGRARRIEYGDPITEAVLLESWTQVGKVK